MFNDHTDNLLHLQAQFTEVSETDLKAMDSQVSELSTKVQAVTQDCRQLETGGQGWIRTNTHSSSYIYTRPMLIPCH